MKIKRMYVKGLSNVKTIANIPNGGDPGFRLQELAPVGGHEEVDAVVEPLLLAHKHQQGGQHNVREQGHKVRQLAVRFHALAQSEKKEKRSDPP